MEQKESLKLRRGLFTGLSAALILVIFVFLYLLTLPSQFELDMSRNHFYSLSEDSLEVLSTVSQPVDIYVMNSPHRFLQAEPHKNAGSNYAVQIYSYLNHYDDLSPHIRIHYTPDYEDFALPNVSEDHLPLLQENDLLIVSGGRMEHLSFQDFFHIYHTEDQGNRVDYSRGEQLLTSSLLSVLSEADISVAMITGYGQPQLPGLTQLLKDGNYRLTEVDLATQELPESTSMVILSAPQWDLEAKEIKKLETYLTSGTQEHRVLFYIASYTQPKKEYFPKLDAFLKKYGIQIEDSVVFENESSLQIEFPNLYKSKVHFSSTEQQPFIGTESLEPVVYYAKPLTLTSPPLPQWAVHSLWETSEYSGIFPPNYQGDDWQVTEKDYTGPVPVLALSTRNTTEESLSVVVLTSGLSLDPTVLESPEVSNREYFISLFDDLTGKQRDIFIPTKEPISSRFSISKTQIFVLMLAVLVVVPLIFFIVGGVVLYRRRSF